MPAAAHVIATWSGPPPGTVYIGAIVEGGGISPFIPVTLSAAQGDIAISPRSGLAIGTYTGRVMARVCADSGCTQPIGGTPLPISYSVTVTPGFVTPTSLSFDAVGGVAATGSLSVQVPVGQTGFDAQVSTGAPWLKLGAPAGGTLPVTALPWRAGSYLAAYECNLRPRTAISPDGATLFFVGDAHLIVAPIPSTLQPATADTVVPRMKAWTPGAGVR
jgi:hypothetical protein